MSADRLPNALRIAAMKLRVPPAIHAQHTPGPWFCTSDDDYPTGQVSTGPLKNGDVCLTFGDDAKANARAIAALPDLVAVVKKLRRGDLHQRVRHLYDEAQLALAKATGAAS